jgi:hypothetical protein
MSVKIPTLAQMKKDRIKKVTEQSTMGFLHNIHAGLCNKFEFIDIPFNVCNEEDRKILDGLIAAFTEKNYSIQKMAELPFQTMTPMGLMNGVNVIHRFQLEPKMTFIEKKPEAKTDLVHG